MPGKDPVLPVGCMAHALLSHILIQIAGCIAHLALCRCSCGLVAPGVDLTGDARLAVSSVGALHPVCVACIQGRHQLLCCSMMHPLVHLAKQAPQEHELRSHRSSAGTLSLGPLAMLVKLVRVHACTVPPCQTQLHHSPRAGDANMLLYSTTQTSASYLGSLGSCFIQPNGHDRRI